MQWDIGVQGIAVLAAMSLGFGLVAQLLLGSGRAGWSWVIATAAFFVVGLLVSEVWFGWATAEELQPNIDGLSFDEVLLALVPGVLVLLGIRLWIHRDRGMHAT